MKYNDDIILNHLQVFRRNKYHLYLRYRINLNTNIGHVPIYYYYETSKNTSELAQRYKKMSLQTQILRVRDQLARDIYYTVEGFPISVNKYPIK